MSTRSLRPKDLQVGVNNIVDERTPEVTLMNGDKEKVKWYLFKIPIKDYEKRLERSGISRQSVSCVCI